MRQQRAFKGEPQAVARAFQAHVGSVETQGVGLFWARQAMLGEAVATVLLRNGVTPTFRQIALPDAFFDAGALPTLHDRYGISTQAVCAQIKGWPLHSRRLRWGRSGRYKRKAATGRTALIFQETLIVSLTGRQDFLDREVTGHLRKLPQGFVHCVSD